MSIGTANAIRPPSPAWTCESTPITLPTASSSGPPELPAYTGIWVWITLVIEFPSGVGNSTLQRRDDAARERPIEAEGVAQRERRIAHSNGRRVAQLERPDVRHRAGAHAQHREVVGRVGAEHDRGDGLAIAELDLDAVVRLGAVDDRVAREDVAGVVDHEARPGR